jgi:hypothetical protein
MQVITFLELLLEVVSGNRNIIQGTKASPTESLSVALINPSYGLPVTGVVCPDRSSIATFAISSREG